VEELAHTATALCEAKCPCVFVCVCNFHRCKGTVFIKTNESAGPKIVLCLQTRDFFTLI